MKTFRDTILYLTSAAMVVLFSWGMVSISHNQSRLEAAQKVASAVQAQEGTSCEHPDMAVLASTRHSFSVYLTCDDGNWLVDYDGETATVSPAS